MAQIFSRYVPTTIPLFGVDVKLKLYAFDKAEGPAFQARVKSHFEGLGTRDGESEADAEKRALHTLKEWQGLCRETFSAVDSKGRGKFVRLVEPLIDEEDESRTEISTGAQLYDIAPGDFHQAVMVRLASFASLSDTEGKSFGSPSTSTVATGQSTDSPASPAPSTADADKRATSTATPMTASYPYSGAV